MRPVIKKAERLTISSGNIFEPALLTAVAQGLERPQWARSCRRFGSASPRSLQPLEAGLRSTQASQNAARTSPAASSCPCRSASPTVSDADSDSLSRASTDDADDSLEARASSVVSEVERRPSIWARAAKTDARSAEGGCGALPPTSVG